MRIKFYQWLALVYCNIKKNITHMHKSSFVLISIHIYQFLQCLRYQSCIREWNKDTVLPQIFGMLLIKKKKVFSYKRALYRDKTCTTLEGKKVIKRKK